MRDILIEGSMSFFVFLEIIKKNLNIFDFSALLDSSTKVLKASAKEKGLK